MGFSTLIEENIGIEHFELYKQKCNKVKIGKILHQIYKKKKKKKLTEPGEEATQEKNTMASVFCHAWGGGKRDYWSWKDNSRRQ